MMIHEVVILALMLWGVSAAFEEGMVLGWLGTWLEKRMPVLILKPLIMCPACMSSVYGTAWSLYFDYSLEQAAILILATCGLNFMIMKHLMR